MADEAAFLEGLWADPDDEELRLVFADWLEEQQDPRAELLRTVIALRRVADPQEHLALWGRLEQLREGASAEWVAAADRRLAEDEVREAVYRHQMGEPGGFGGIWYLQCEKRQDPPAATLARLTAQGYSVQPHSLRSSEGRGVVLTAGQVHWRERGLCEVDGSVYHGPLAAHGAIYHVQAQGTKWVVTRSRGTWIS
jgi:uncharacterized protein (TIGR02996 family)